MLTNDQMIAGRFATWAAARRKLAKIVSTLEAGKKVIVSTYTRATRFDKRHVDMFKATRTGLYIQSGKRWECADYCKFTVEG